MKSIHSTLILVVGVSSAVFALAGAPKIHLNSDAELALYDDETQAQYRAEAAFLTALSYQDGLIQLPGGIAQLQIPEDYYYLSPEDAQKVLVEAWGNPPGDELPLGMIFPARFTPLADEAWGVTVDYEADGHVSDEDANQTDYNALFDQMQADMQQSNEWRLSEGYGSIELVGWAARPYYDEVGKKLHWAKELRFDNSADTTLNYNIRVLGREGVLVLNFIADMEQLAQVENALPTVLNMPGFSPGNTYGDFDSSLDTLAAYGIGGLVAGKVLAKTGFFVVALIFLKKFGIVLVLGLVAVARKFFAGRDEKEK
ncbi:DUF2167 domain-containing protein [Reinekea sp.]|jgi:uncharacterized membrane-anchored protein|uniref:DUF2167 domain-containing protein n=1 Tax=Reinekea sp. TaxID=1970455 RepID=UPI002A840E87|nr:DUF2167 domain-containing protein [Reinekea sp.]